MAELVKEIEKQGGQAVPIVCDVTDDATVEAAFKKISDIGDIEVLVYNVAPPYQPGINFHNMTLSHEVEPDHL